MSGANSFPRAISRRDVIVFLILVEENNVSVTARVHQKIKRKSISSNENTGRTQCTGSLFTGLGLLPAGTLRSVSHVAPGALSDRSLRFQFLPLLCRVCVMK